MTFLISQLHLLEVLHLLVHLLDLEKRVNMIIKYEVHHELGLFGTLKLALALEFIVMNAYFSVARTLTLVLHATLK